MNQDAPRVSRDERMQLVDSLRGFALLGLFLVHMVERFELYWAHPTGGPVVDWTFGLFAGKAYALFALCFGLSFFIIMDRAARRGVDFTGRFAWRLVVLLAFGVAHSFIYRGDILQVLAVMGLLLIPFNGVRDNRVLLALSALFLAQPFMLAKIAASVAGADWANQPPGFSDDPAMAIMTGGTFVQNLAANVWQTRLFNWSFTLESGRASQILGLFLAGLVLGRTGFFADPERFKTLRWAWLVAGALAWAAFTFGKPALIALLPEAGEARGTAGWVIGGWAALGVLSVEVMAFIALYQSVGRRVLGWLAAAGRMTLTLYVAQSLLFVPVFYGWGLGLWDDLSSWQCLGLGLAAFALQVVFAHLWFRAFRYGPLEWLWRAATYLSREVPFVRREAPAAA